MLPCTFLGMSSQMLVFFQEYLWMIKPTHLLSLTNIALTGHAKTKQYIVMKRTQGKYSLSYLALSLSSLLILLKNGFFRKMFFGI